METDSFDKYQLFLTVHVRSRDPGAIFRRPSAARAPAGVTLREHPMHLSICKRRPRLVVPNGQTQQGVRCNEPAAFRAVFCRVCPCAFACSCTHTHACTVCIPSLVRWRSRSSSFNVNVAFHCIYAMHGSFSTIARCMHARVRTRTIMGQSHRAASC